MVSTTSISPVSTPGSLIHDAWRSVRMEDPAYADDPRFRSNYDELAPLNQGLCIVTAGRMDRAIGRQLLSGEGFDVGFVRSTMELIYDGYHRYTKCMKGLGRSGLDWFGDSSTDGPRAISAVTPYRTLAHSAKEIDRRMVVLGLNNLPDSQLPDAQREVVRSDAESILRTAHTRVPYDYTLGFAHEASFD